MRVEVKQEHIVATNVAPHHEHFDEEEQGENYIKERVKALAGVKRLSFLSALLLVAQLVLIIIHLTIHGLEFAWDLLGFTIAFLIFVIATIYWTNQATKAYKANTELFQPRVNDRLTKAIYIGALLAACVAVVLMVNLLVQREYSPDFVVAHSAVQETWDDAYGSRTPEGLSKYLRVSFWIQFGFEIYYIIYFLIVARASFRCLKFGNQAMSYLVFLGNVLLLAFGLAVIYFADHALGYGDYPQIRAHFPFWNVRGLYFGGICVAAVALLGFLVDHRSWRVGFLVLSFLLLILIVLLGNFTGFAYRHINNTYHYYKGVPDRDTCINRMQIVHFQELEDFGCPQKYLPEGTPCDNPKVEPWEELKATVEEQNKRSSSSAPAKTQSTPPPTTTTTTTTTPTSDQTQSSAPANSQPAPADSQQTAAPNQSAQPDNSGNGSTSTTRTQDTTTNPDGSTSTTTTTTTTTTSSDNSAPPTLTMYEVDLSPQRYDYEFERVLQGASNSNEYCLNTRCCGLLGQLYTDSFLSLANAGLCAMLAAIFISIACYYFWFVKWVDAARDKRKDYVWLVIMIVIILGFVFAFVALNQPYIIERVDSAQRHLASLI